MELREIPAEIASRVVLKTNKLSGAVFSQCGLYRYALWRDTKTFHNSIPRTILFLMLNPSTASELVLDPTVRGCRNRAWKWGFERMYVANLFAFRSTKPTALYFNEKPVGEYNDTFIDLMADRSEVIICAWGEHGKYRQRSKQVLDRLREKHESKLKFLRMNRSGEPAHPLYLPMILEPSTWNADTPSIALTTAT